MSVFYHCPVKAALLLSVEIKSSHHLAAEE